MNDPASVSSRYRVDSQYRLSVFVSAIPGVLFVSLLGIGVWIRSVRQAPPNIASTTLFGGIALCLLVGWVWMTDRAIRKTWLCVNATGITYAIPGLMVVTSWDNINCIDERNRQAFLLLHQRSATYMSMWMRFCRATTSAQRNVDRRIPIGMFECSVSSRLRQDIGQFAPRLVVSVSEITRAL